MTAVEARPRARHWLNITLWATMIAACLFYAARLLWIVHAHAVDILFRDQWGFYPVVYNGSSWWRAFSHQHGPHRQGLGNLVSKALLPITHANIRAEALIIALLIIVAGVLAVWLRKRATGKIRWYDGFLVLLLLTPAQYALFARVPNASHGAWPLVLLLVTAMVLLMRRGWVQVALLAVLMFVSVYTGFAVFLGAAVPFVLGLLFLRASAQREYRIAAYHLLTIVLCCAAATTFFISYRPETSAPVPLGGHPWLTYPNLMAYQFSRLGGFAVATKDALIGGWVIMSICGFVAVYHLVKFARRSDPPAESLIIVMMMVFVFGYSANTAYGRASFGGWIMVSSRYLPLMAPAAIAVFLHIVTVRRNWLRYVTIALFAMATLWATAQMREPDVRDMVQLSEGKKRWLAAYMETGDIFEAQRISNFQLYPKLEQLRGGLALKQMKERNLGPFRKKKPAIAE